MSPHRIQPGWRYTLAQYVLRVLFGRTWHQISPWKLVGISVSVLMMTSNGKILLQKRAGNIENVGKWGVFGGYLSAEHHEIPADTVVREVWEECGLTLAKEQFVRAPDNVIMQYNQSKIDMADHTTCAIQYFAITHNDLIHQLKVSDEVSDFQWLTEDELDTLWHNGEIAGDALDHYLPAKSALHALKSGKPIPALKLA